MLLQKILLFLTKCFYWRDSSPLVHSNHKCFIDLKYRLQSKDFVYRLPLVINAPYELRTFYIENEHGEDVTSHVTAYMGPRFDFHGQLFTPSDLGFQKLLFREDGIVHVFGENQIIRV